MEMQTPSQNSPLLTLPAELRNRIYGEVLVSARKIDVAKGSHSAGRWRPPTLLQTCRQIRKEASPVYYSQNAFTVGYSTPLTEHSGYARDMMPWLKALSAEQQRMLTNLFVDGSMYFDIREGEDALQYYYKSLSDAGLALVEGVLFVEVYHESLSRDTFWHAGTTRNSRQLALS